MSLLTPSAPSSATPALVAVERWSLLCLPVYPRKLFPGDHAPLMRVVWAFAGMPRSLRTSRAAS